MLTPRGLSPPPGHITNTNYLIQNFMIVSQLFRNVQDSVNTSNPLYTFICTNLELISCRNSHACSRFTVNTFFDPVLEETDSYKGFLQFSFSFLLFSPHYFIMYIKKQRFIFVLENTFKKSLFAISLFTDRFSIME